MILLAKLPTLRCGCKYVHTVLNWENVIKRLNKFDKGTCEGHRKSMVLRQTFEDMEFDQHAESRHVCEHIASATGLWDTSDV